MKPLAIALLLGLAVHLVVQAGDPPQKVPINTLTEKEKKEGWKLLFDGKTLAGWRLFKKKDAGCWSVKDGCMFSNDCPSDTDIMTVDQYANFEFQADWKFVKGDNSGIIYRVGEEGAETWTTGPEMQIMLPYKDQKLDKYAGGALYDVLIPTVDALKPADQWNTFKVVANGKHVEHWVNGVKVVDFVIGSEVWKKAIANSKWADEKLYASRDSGHIALQSHGDPVLFRNVKIRVLP